jgi:hypothetical protein
MNPYIVAGMLSHGEAFVGRKDVLRDVARVLADTGKSALALHGQRRIGKTSILHRLATYLPKQGSYCSLFFDLQGKAALPLQQVLAELATHLALLLELPSPPSWDEEGPSSFRDDFLPQVLAHLSPNTSLVFLFDEFDVLSDPDEALAGNAFFPFLRDLLALDPHRVKSVFAIGPRPDDFGLIPSVFNGIESFSISLLSAKETATLVRLSERDESLFWSDEAVSRIETLTGGHPLLIQHLCRTMWKQAHQDDPVEPPTVQVDDVMAAVPAVLRTSANSLEWVWDGLGLDEQLVSSVIAAADGEAMTQDELKQRLVDNEVRLSIGDLKKSVRVLRRWDLIDAEHRFRVELLRRWVKEYKPPNRVQDDHRLHTTADNLFRAAYGFYQGEDHEQATTLLRQALGLNPNHLQANYLFVELLLSQREIAEARQRLEDLYLYHPAAARSRLVKALLLQVETADNDKELLALYERVLELEPYHPEAKARYQRLCSERGDKALATDHLHEALHAYQQAGLSDKAIRVGLQQITVLEKEEEYKSALNLTRYLYRTYPEARDQLPDLKRLERQARLDTLYRQALEAWQNNDSQKAQKLLAQVAVLEPGYRETIRHLYLAATGLDVSDLQTQLEREKNERQQVETRAKEDAAATEAKLVALQAQLEVERRNREQLEVAIERGALLRRERESELEQLKDGLETQAKARRQAEANAKVAKTRMLWAVVFGIVGFLMGIGGFLYSGIVTSPSTSTVVTVEVASTKTPPTTPATTSTVGPVATSKETEIVGCVNITALKLRTEPNTESEEVRILLADDPVVAVARNATGDWVQVRLPEDGSEGWLPAAPKYVKWLGDVSSLPDETELGELPQQEIEIVGLVSITSLSLRSEPSTDSEKRATLLADDPVTGIGRNAVGDWVLVRLEDGSEGWLPAAEKYVDWMGDVSALPESE